ncbi:hypothetical protein [Undibacterium sp. Di24W]|uniref:hypothetical protein n=1 Tax=Undibacterium sp. Di24W TaxID=3413033 RepID=UPI003BF254D0
MKYLIFAVAMIGVMPHDIYAQDQSKGTEKINAIDAQAVVVSGTRDPDWKTYKAFLAGMKIFDAQHQLAPLADLRFILRPRSHQTNVGDVKMTIETDDIRIPVPVSEEGIFVLPRDERAAENGAEIFLGKKRNTLSWRPAIHTPGLPAGTRRLGDLRLECIVRWTIEQADMLAFFRGTINAFGGPCSSAMIKVDYISVQALAAVYLVSEHRSGKLAGKWIEEGGHVYLPPIHDQTWPDDTLLEFEYVRQKSGK